METTQPIYRRTLVVELVLELLVQQRELPSPQLLVARAWEVQM